MTKEDIKDMYSMREIVERYGFKLNRAGFIPCPFHAGDRQASLKVYEKDFHCHACGANGDVFTFVQLMDNLTFPEAFIELGGEYEQSFSAKMKIYHHQQRRLQEDKRVAERLRNQRLNYQLISIYRKWIDRLEPFSEAWCECQNKLTKQIAILEQEIEVRHETVK